MTSSFDPVSGWWLSGNIMILYYYYGQQKAVLLTPAAALHSITRNMSCPGICHADTPAAIVQRTTRMQACAQISGLRILYACIMRRNYKILKQPRLRLKKTYLFIFALQRHTFWVSIPPSSRLVGTTLLVANLTARSGAQYF